LKKIADALIKLYSKTYYFLKFFVIWGTAPKIAMPTAAVNWAKIFEWVRNCNKNPTHLYSFLLK
jgi:hypothetical protein